MKKLIVLIMLLFATSAFSCDVCGYTHTATIPYLVSSGGWWTGVAVTNATDDIVKGRVSYSGGFDNFVLEPCTVSTIAVDATETCCGKVEATGAVFITIMTGSDNALTSYVTQATNDNQ